MRTPFDYPLKVVNELISDFTMRGLLNYVERYLRPLATELECDKAHYEDITWDEMHRSDI